MITVYRSFGIIGIRGVPGGIVRRVTAVIVVVLIIENEENVYAGIGCVLNKPVLGGEIVYAGCRLNPPPIDVHSYDANARVIHHLQRGGRFVEVVVTHA